MEYLSRIGGRSGEAALAAFVEARGPIQHHQVVSESVLENWTGRAPNLMIDFWRHHGTGALNDGQFWFPMPGALQAPIDLLFGGDPDFDGDTIALAYGAMGNVLAWSIRHGPVLIVLQGGSVQAPGLFRPNSRLPADAELMTLLRDLHPFFFDAVDKANEPLLARALERNAPLLPGEVFAIYPIRGGGPEADIAGVQTMPLADYLTDVVLNVQFTLRDYEGGNLNVRTIGRQDQ